MRTPNPIADRFNERIQEGLERGYLLRHEPYAYAAALFTYSSDSGYKEIPQALKYDGNIPAGRYFASLLGEKLSQSEHFLDVDLVIPVPLHPLRRGGTPEDIANAALFLASDLSSYVSGQVIAINGALYC